MAGIERICEYSGEGCSGEMYKYKRNSIQILPKYRKLFRLANATLIIFKPEINYQRKRNGFITSFINADHDSYKVVLSYYYILQVPSIQGRVKGEYMNHTYDLAATKRKLKRLLRCRELVIEYKDIEIQEYFKERK